MLTNKLADSRLKELKRGVSTGWGGNPAPRTKEGQNLLDIVVSNEKDKDKKQTPETPTEDTD